MSELEDFKQYLLNTPMRSTPGSPMFELKLNLGNLINAYLYEKNQPKGFHGDCTSTKHSIGSSYCPECLP